MHGWVRGGGCVKFLYVCLRVWGVQRGREIKSERGKRHERERLRDEECNRKKREEQFIADSAALCELEMAYIIY